MLNTTCANVSNNESISCNPNAIYGDVDHHICCLIPIYIDGGDCTACYYVDGRREIIHKSIKMVLREVAHHEGVLANGIQSSRRSKPMYTDPRTMSPNMTFASLKSRKPSGVMWYMVYSMLSFHFNTALSQDQNHIQRISS